MGQVHLFAGVGVVGIRVFERGIIFFVVEEFDGFRAAEAGGFDIAPLRVENYQLMGARLCPRDNVHVNIGKRCRYGGVTGVNLIAMNGGSDRMAQAVQTAIYLSNPGEIDINALAVDGDAEVGDILSDTIVKGRR